jgi:hypothetical protein
MEGKAYDTASNTNGKLSAVQHKNLCMKPTAIVTACNRHSLNLVVNNAAMPPENGV